MAVQHTLYYILRWWGHQRNWVPCCVWACFAFSSPAKTQLLADAYSHHLRNGRTSGLVCIDFSDESAHGAMDDASAAGNLVGYALTLGIRACGLGGVRPDRFWGSDCFGAVPPLAAISPYQTEHINRYGSYKLRCGHEFSSSNFCTIRLSQALRLGRREHRRNIQLLSIAAAASQESEMDQYAGAVDARNQATHAGRTNLPKHGRLFTAGASVGSRNARKLDRGHAASQHGTAPRAEKRSLTQAGRCGVMVSPGLTRARRSQAALALDPIPASKVQSAPPEIAELDKRNCEKSTVVVMRQARGRS
jgi:hypothetical protein